MIVVVDTNALHGDVYAQGAWAQTLFAAAEKQDDLEVRTPSVVVEELVRQFPERFDELDRAFAGIRHAVNAYGLTLPKLPDRDEAVSQYRDRLEKSLTGPGRSVVPPPSDAGVIAEWIAQRREPIPNDGDGAIDAQIWLTAVEAARDDEEVVLITNNTDDFSDPDDKTRPHPTLRGDLTSRGLDEDAVTIAFRILDFNQEHVEPAVQATSDARALLANPSERAHLIAAIEEAVEWFAFDIEDRNWALGTDIDSANVAAFDIEDLRLIRADEAPKGTYVTIEAIGIATAEIWLWKGEAHTLPNDSPIEIDDYDFNESMATGRATLPARLLAEVRLVEGEDLAVSIEEIGPVTEDEVLAILESWAEEHPDEALALIADGFDVSGEQEARAVHPSSVEKFVFSHGDIYVRAAFKVDYANPIDEEDHHLSAENVTDYSVDLKIEGPDLSQAAARSIDTAPSFFPN